MTLGSARLEARRKLTCLVILCTGFGIALVIYVTATPPPANPFGYEPEDSKKYLREMEVYGGKANLLASSLREWFESLWHGRRLAFTVVCLTLMVLLLYLIASTPVPPRADPAPESERKPGGAGS